MADILCDCKNPEGMECKLLCPGIVAVQTERKLEAKLRESSPPCLTPPQPLIEVIPPIIQVLPPNDIGYQTN